MCSPDESTGGNGSVAAAITHPDSAGAANEASPVMVPLLRAMSWGAGANNIPGSAVSHMRRSMDSPRVAALVPMLPS